MFMILFFILGMTAMIVFSLKCWLGIRQTSSRLSKIYVAIVYFEWALVFEWPVQMYVIDAMYNMESYMMLASECV